MARYSMLLENPRRRRSRKRRSSRRRKNPAPFARRRRSSGRRRSRGGRRRSNPFRLPGLGGMGGIKGTLGKGVELYLGRFTGRLALGLLNKVDFFANLPDAGKAVGLGILLPMIPASGMFKRFLSTAGSLAIAGAIANMAAGVESQVFGAINVTPGELGDYVTDAGMGEYGLLGSDEYGADAYLNDYVTDMG